MKNYTEMFEKMTDIDEIKATIAEINDNIKDNEKYILNDTSIVKALESINENNKNIFTNAFITIFNTDAKVAFADLLKKPHYTVYAVIYKDNAYSIKESARLFKFIDLEKGYKASKAKTDTDGNITNIDEVNKATIFGALRFYGLTSCFIRNLQKSNFEIDKENGYNLAKVVLNGEQVFTDIDGKCFESNSNNNLEKQLNVIVKFFGYDVQMLKKDLPILKIKAQKIKQNKQNAKFTVNAIIDDKTVLKFADVIFGVVASRINGEDIEVITSKPKKKD